MTKFSRYFLLLALGSIVLMFGCGGGGTAPQTAPATYTVVAISDIHFNPLYDPALYPALAAAPASEWERIFQSAQNSSQELPSAWGSDTNYPALVLALDSVKQNLGASPVILFSGDMLGHDIPEWFCALNSSPPLPITNPPASCTLNAAGTVAMQQFIDKAVAFVSLELRATAGKVPVIFVPGNIDTYSVYGAGPNTDFLADNASTLYAQLLKGSAGHTTFQKTFATMGSYTAQPLGSKLLVVALNSNPLAAANVPPPLDPYAELTWLDSQLAAAQSAGQKVWLLMHVPPGANTTETAQIAAQAGTPAKTTADEAAMMWQPQYQIEFMQILAGYPGLITMAVTGHTHMDEFRVLPTGDVMYGIPGVSPCFGNNPAFKVFTIAQDTGMPMDYQSISYGLGVSPAPAQFTSLYTFSSAYGAAANTSLQSSSRQLYPQLTPNAAGTSDFIQYYDSDNGSMIPGLNIQWNKVSAVNWPLYACGISQMDAQDYVSCVNSY